jgi:hypothetical protein
MGVITIPGRPLLWVRWGCRRCGHQGGIARTTVPLVDPTTPEVFMRELFAALRRKLIKIHLRQGCVATVEDFTVERVTPEGKTIEALV